MVLIRFVAAFTFFLLLFAITLFAQGVRPILDNVGYCWQADRMKMLIDYLMSIETDSIIPAPVAGISPHDDYLYAARLYDPLFRAVRAKEAVIFGVTHATVRKEIGDPQNILLLDHFDEWCGPRKNVKISPLREFIRERLDTSFFRVNNKAQQLEHSIEGLIPFLQYYNPDVQITPIMVTAMPFERMDEISDQLSDIMSSYIRENKLVVGKDIVFLMSSDANHYGDDFNNSPFGEDSLAHDRGTKQDLRVANEDLTGTVKPSKIAKLTEELKNILWCGKYSVPFGLLTTEKTIEKTLHRHLQGKLLRYSDTYTEGVIPLKHTGMGTTAPFSLKHWVGFFSAAFYLE